MGESCAGAWCKRIACGFDVKDEDKLESPVAKFLPDNFFAQAQKSISNDSTWKYIIFLVAGPYKDAWDILGGLRLELAHELKMIPEDEFNF